MFYIVNCVFCFHNFVVQVGKLGFVVGSYALFKLTLYKLSLCFEYSYKYIDICFGNMRKSLPPLPISGKLNHSTNNINNGELSGVIFSYYLYECSAILNVLT